MATTPINVQETTLCLKDVPPLACYNLYIHGLIATTFGINVPQKVGDPNVLLFFPPHLTSASALPGETGNPEIASFHLMLVGKKGGDWLI